MPRQECDAVRFGLVDNPIGFLRNNLLWVDGDAEDLFTAGRLRRFDVLADASVQLFGPNKGEVGGRAYNIKENQNGELVAHYVPWAHDAGYYIVLSGQSPIRIAITGTQSGCATGYISAPDGTTRFIHHNISGVEGSDVGTNDKAMKESLAYAQGAMHRSDYRKPLQEIEKEGPWKGWWKESQCTTVGVLTDRWRFYVQKIKLKQLYYRWTQITEVIEI